MADRKLEQLTKELSEAQEKIEKQKEILITLREENEQLNLSIQEADVLTASLKGQVEAYKQMSFNNPGMGKVKVKREPTCEKKYFSRIPDLEIMKARHDIKDKEMSPEIFTFIGNVYKTTDPDVQEYIENLVMFGAGKRIQLYETVPIETIKAAAKAKETKMVEGPTTSANLGGSAPADPPPAK